MDLTLDIKIDDFNAAMDEMALQLGSSSGVTKRKIVDNEVSKILEKTLAGTDTATKASINASIKSKEWTTYPSGGGKRYKLSWHFPNSLWGSIQAQGAASLARKIARAGWTRKSWWSLGVLIGYNINSKGSETAVIPGRSAQDAVSAKRDESQGNYVLAIRNSSPLLDFTGSRRAFFSAVAGRTGFFRQNLAHGVFDDLSQVAKKYPGLEVSVPPPAS